ncbi:c-type cytochrome biogenesis protein CcmI [Stagnihabitans tardus]|uniref:C-type cytochrome biogenesis protein CcmI n=1 Tax=Stagnihabitans tardus TaxID=2699202 RepID=A0AAE4Y9J3_9RHOB|nr:c-type cytochrome biogenesis protein CcmI [Stagnihabitans tardus]NBZ87602.1 c-type cytochrome biogenesis protein CcmI [Stagnihabitans tardus]
MITFWISAGAMCLMVAVVLFQALRRGAADEGPADVAIYRDQLAEVARDEARGTISQDEAARLRLEVSRRLLEADKRQAEAGGALPAWLPGAVIAGLLALAVFLYNGGGPVTGLGAPGYEDLPLALRLSQAEEAYAARPSQEAAEAARDPWVAPEGTDAQTLELMDKLRAAVAGRPQDLTGHELLVENEIKLGNFAGARKAQEGILAIKGDKAGAEDWLRAAELKIYATGGVVTPEAEADLGEVLGRDPQNGAARFWLGLMAAQVGRPDRAFQMWEPLLAEGPQDAPWMEPIRSQIEQVAAAAGVPYALPETGPSAEDMAAAAEMSPEDRQAMIETMVAGLEERLMAEGGPVEDWVKLINALMVLQAPDRAKAAYAKARADLAADPGAMAALKAAADAAGVAE